MKKGKRMTTTIKEIANDYKVDRKTIYNWLKPIRQELLDMYPMPKKNLSLLFPKQIKRIYEFLGEA